MLPPSPPQQLIPGPASPAHLCRDSESVVARILEFANSLSIQSGDLVCRVGWGLYLSPKLQTFLESLNLKYDYNADTCTLTVKCMPTPIHDSLNSFVHETVVEMAVSGFLTATERKLLKVRSRAHLLPSVMYTATSTGTGRGVKKPASQKTPDIEFCPAGATFPSVVFEVGFTESYHDLLEDAGQWLIKGGGFTKLFVLVKFEEDRAALLSHQQEKSKTALEASNHDNHSSEPNSVRDVSDSSQDSPSSSPRSTASEYIDLKPTLDISDYVGPIKAFTESWRYNPLTRSIYQDGDRVDIYPSLTSSLSESTPQGVSLNITDIFPNNPKEYDYTPTDPDKKWTLDLSGSSYQSEIKSAIRELALIRMGGARKRKRALEREEGYAEYQEQVPNSDMESTVPNTGRRLRSWGGARGTR